MVCLYLLLIGFPLQSTPISSLDLGVEIQSSITPIPLPDVWCHPHQDPCSIVGNSTCQNWNRMDQQCNTCSPCMRPQSSPNMCGHNPSDAWRSTSGTFGQHITQSRCEIRQARAGRRSLLLALSALRLGTISECQRERRPRTIFRGRLNTLIGG